MLPRIVILNDPITLKYLLRRDHEIRILERHFVWSHEDVLHRPDAITSWYINPEVCFLAYNGATCFSEIKLLASRLIGNNSSLRYA